MGNRLTVDYQIFGTNVVNIKHAGSKNILIKKTFTKNLKIDYHFSPSIFQSKTFIVNVNDKVSRAVSNNSSIRITQSEEGELKIAVLPKGNPVESSLEQIIDNEETKLNWNIIADGNVKNEYTKAANDVINLMNNFTQILATGIGSAVRIIPANKEAVNYASKFASDMITNFMKTAVIKSELEKDPHSVASFQRIHHQLVAVSRAVEIDYVYLTTERNIDSEKALEFLHHQMMKITNTDMLPFLEVCDMEEAVIIYMFAIRIVMEICNKMNQITGNIHNKLQQSYMLIFSNNLYEIWNNVLIKMAKDAKIKTTGCLIKTAHLKYGNKHIYKVKSFCKDRANSRINDIRDAFITNMKYQLGYFYGNPEEVIIKCKEASYFKETSESS